MSGWNYRKDSKTSVEEIRLDLEAFENASGKDYPKQARVNPHLDRSDVGRCYPNCDRFTDMR